MGSAAIGSHIRNGRDGALLVAAFASLTLFAATVAVQAGRYLNLDVAWYVYAATHVDLGGCRLYVDCFVDTNPPFALWLDAAAVRAGALAGLDPVASIRLAVAVFSLVAGVLLYAVLQAVLRQGGALALALASGYLAIVGVASVGDYGQREHLIALMVAPYVASVPLAIERRGWSAALALTTGGLAGFAVAIKPYYVLLPLACELWVAWRLWGLRAMLRPQVIALAATIVACAVAVALWAPGYLSLARVIASAYPAYQEGLAPLLQLDRVTVALMLLPLVAWTVASAPECAEPTLSLTVAATAAAAAYFYQRMGYSYQGIPALSIGLFAAYCAGLRLFTAGPRRNIVALCAFGCVLLMLVPVAGRLVARHGVEAMAMLPGARPDASGAPSGDDGAVVTYAQETAWMAAAIDRYAGNGDVGYLSTSIDPLFPALLYTDARLANRMPHLWLLPALTRDRREHLDEATRTELQSRLLESLREDLGAQWPGLIIEVRGRVQGVAEDGFSPVRFLSANPEFERMFLAYREAERMRRGSREVVLYVPDPSGSTGR